ncbi:hypothetical protein QTN54_04870 [Leuconostoc mesenteroides]|uniref:hypothetical protein n=1 Tax=Leuconostoc mesenteroides TaxID=1245 RepID=UPI00259FF931|nr:hypothetical protein [Leuconostoc mesenteroides]WJM74099.1 hypothetical protein QTN54_04870 [Leuconostoc mesenteroides]
MNWKKFASTIGGMWLAYLVYKVITLIHNIPLMGYNQSRIMNSFILLLLFLLH